MYILFYNYNLNLCILVCILIYIIFFSYQSMPHGNNAQVYQWEKKIHKKVSWHKKSFMMTFWCLWDMTSVHPDWTKTATLQIILSHLTLTTFYFKIHDFTEMIKMTSLKNIMSNQLYCLLLVLAGSTFWFWWKWRVHVISWASFPPLQLSGVWGTAVHDSTELHRVGHHERTPQWVTCYFLMWTCAPSKP